MDQHSLVSSYFILGVGWEGGKLKLGLSIYLVNVDGWGGGGLVGGYLLFPLFDETDIFLKHLLDLYSLGTLYRSLH